MTTPYLKDGPVGTIGHTGLICTRDGPVAAIKLNRPDKRNALDEAILIALYEILDVLRQDSDVKVVVMSAAGAVFSAGADISPLKGIIDPTERRRAFAPLGMRISDRLADVMKLLTAPDILTIAEVNGSAVGAGWLLAMGCDFRVTAEDAQFWFPEIELGRPVSAPTAELVVAHLGPAIAKEILLLARRYNADELLRMRMVNRVLPSGQLAGASREIACRLAGLDKLALSVVKQRINANINEGFWARKS